MKVLLLIIFLALMPLSAVAEIFKCRNPDTGAIEFKDSPCAAEQVEQAVSESVSKMNRTNSDEEAIVLTMIEEDRERFQEVCEEQLNRNRLSEDQYKKRCETALRKQAECKMAASRMFPEKVHTSYVRARMNGMSHSAATREARAQENWGDVSTQEAMVIAMPIAEFTSGCIRKIFD